MHIPRGTLTASAYRAGGLGGLQPPLSEKNSIIRAKLMYCSGKDTVENILLFNILIYLSSSRIPQNGLHDILPVLYKVTSILVSKQSFFALLLEPKWVRFISHFMVLYFRNVHLDLPKIFALL